MALWIQSLPDWLFKNLDVITLIVVGYLAERHYVSRPTAFSNSIGINLVVLRLVKPHWLLRAYADLGVVVALFSLFSYGSVIWFMHQYPYSDLPREFPYRLVGKWYTLFQLYNSVFAALILCFAVSWNAWLNQNIPNVDLPFGI